MQEVFRGRVIEILMFIGIIVLILTWLLHYVGKGETVASILIYVANITPPDRARTKLANHFPSNLIAGLILLLMIVLAVDIIVTNIPDQTYGLLIDGFAAWLLASDIYIQEQDLSSEVDLQTSSVTDEEIKSTAVKTWGAFLLLFGFILQLISINSNIIS